MTAGLVLQLAVASGMVALTVLMHLGGLGLLIALMRAHTQRFMTRRAIVNQAVILLGAAFGLFALHTAEIWAYALLYEFIGAAPNLEDSVYFSTVTYSTIGYGDLTLGRAWRILGAIEGANGIILLGWSTAFFVSVVGRIRALEHDWSVGEPPP